jgi:hypothetical protein
MLLISFLLYARAEGMERRRKEKFLANQGQKYAWKTNELRVEIRLVKFLTANENGNG